MKLFLACSKHFYERIPPIASELEGLGHLITYPNSYHEPFAEERMKKMSQGEHIRWKAEMMRKDRTNIAPQDALFVLNFEKNGRENYIGGATFLEMYVAWEMRKKIFVYNPFPQCDFTDELIGIHPTVINGDLRNIQ